MKTAICQVPSDLPNAAIYIDDLMEAENIVKLTTHEELAEHRGSGNDFELFVTFKLG